MNREPKARQRDRNLMYLPWYTLIVAGIVYAFTLAPGVTWGDSAKLANASRHLALTHVAGHHTLHNAAGYVFNKVVPHGSIAWRQNVMSGFFGLCTLFVLGLLVRHVTESNLAAAATMASLAFSHVFWTICVVTESYTLSAFLLALMAALALAWNQTGRTRWICLSAALGTLALLNNLLFAAYLPALALFILMRPPEGRSPALWLRVGMSALAGLAPMGALLLLSLGDRSIGQGVREMLDLNYTGSRFAGFGTYLMEIPRTAGLLFYQFPVLGCLVGLLGLWSGLRRHPRSSTFFLVVMLINLMFANGYMAQRRPFVMSTAFVAWSYFVGLGAEAILVRFQNGQHQRKVIPGLLLLVLLLGVLPPGVYWATPVALEAVDKSLFRASAIPGRDNNRWFLRPWKQDQEAPILYGRDAASVASGNAVIFGEFTLLSVLAYQQQTEGQLDPKVKLRLAEGIDIVEEIRGLLPQRKVFLANDTEAIYRVSELREEFEVVPMGPLLEVRPRPVPPEGEGG